MATRYQRRVESVNTLLIYSTPCKVTVVATISSSRSPRGRRSARPSGDDRELAILTTAEQLLERPAHPYTALLLRSSIVMLDGDPAWPDLLHQWRLAERNRATIMGVSPPFLMACRKAGLQPSAVALVA